MKPYHRKTETSMAQATPLQGFHLEAALLSI
jgi:hypothetical protein